MQVFGHLLMRRLIKAKVVETVVNDLIHTEEPTKMPEEPMVRRACELLELSGEFLDRTHSHLMNCFCARLCDLAKHAKRQSFASFAEFVDAMQAGTPNVLYSEQTGIRIRNLIDYRKRGWITVWEVFH